MTVVVDDQLGLGRSTLTRFVGTELGRWRVPGEWRDHGRAMAAGSDRAGGGIDRRRGHGWFHQDIDRAAAGETHVPGILVADPIADHPGPPGPSGALDLLGRGTLDTTATDRPGDPSVGGIEQDRPLRAWR